jgi:hypothetical protein
MMTDEQRSRTAELKAALAATVGGAPREVRAVVMKLKHELRRDGTTARELAAALGVHESTLCRWEREEGSSIVAGPVKKGQGRGAGFRMVQVTAPMVTSARVAAGPVSASRDLRVAHAPSGLVIDGLDVDGLVALLRRLS